jgi:hypothetical protein
MRWKNEELVSTKIGNIRIIEIFLFLPKTLYNKKLDILENRWLEKVRIKQKYVKKKMILPETCIVIPYNDWEDFEWEN